ncbi:hypothetical protein ABMC88_15535 [Sulfitobacter sp. HNIBRBA2951]|nr:hypothetical protein [uncultured Sulfitobacter sp.]
MSQHPEKPCLDAHSTAAQHLQYVRAGSQNCDAWTVS